MKKIPITKGLYTLIDDDMYDLVGSLKWYAQKMPHTYYAVRNSSMKDDPTGDRHNIYLHWVIAGEPFNGFEVDHIDGDGLNNQRYNLRITTIRKNQHNRNEHRNGKLVGCSLHKPSGRWIARIRINGPQKVLGRFDTELEAHEAYMKALEDLENV